MSVAEAVDTPEVMFPAVVAVEDIPVVTSPGVGEAVVVTFQPVVRRRRRACLSRWRGGGGGGGQVPAGGGSSNPSPGGGRH